jgi:phage shock protein A
MNDLKMNLVGFPAVNRDLKVQVRDPITQEVVREVSPFLDGSVRIPGLAAGNYDIQVIHPNMILPVMRRPIRVLPVGETAITVMIDPSKFLNTPIEDIPEANLGPIADMTQSIAATVAPLASKIPGEAIRSTDWNMLAAAVRDLSDTTGELSRVVSPVGHNHPELEAKINEMSSNFQTLLDSMSQALAGLQRQLQMLSLRRQVDDVLDKAGLAAESAQGKDLRQLIDGLETKVTESPLRYSREMRGVAVQMQTRIEQLLDEKPDLVAAAEVEKIGTSLDLLKGQRSTSYAAEFSANQRLDAAIGGGAFQALKRG